MNKVGEIVKLTETKLKYISKNNRGYYGIGASAVDYDKDKYTYLRITDINDDGTLNTTALMSVDDEKACEFLLKENDIVFARTGASTGRNYFYDGEINNMVFAGFLIKFSLDNEAVNPRFIKYYCLSQNYKNWIASSLTGSTRPNINERQLSEMPIILPNREYQDRAVKILDDITKKIKLNNHTNDNLYEMMKIKFEDWITNLNKYEVSSLSKIAKYTNGLTMQKFRPKDNEESLPVIKIKEMNDGITENTERCSTNIKDEVIINNGDVLFAWSGTLCMSIWGKGKAGLNQHIFKVTSDKYPKWFYYFWTLKHLNRFKMIAAGKATTMGHIKMGELDISEVLIPKNKELQEMHKIMQPLFNKYINNLIQNETLTQLRDTLLPKLMNGEIDLDKIKI